MRRPVRAAMRAKVASADGLFTIKLHCSKHALPSKTDYQRHGSLAGGERWPLQYCRNKEASLEVAPTTFVPHISVNFDLRPWHSNTTAVTVSRNQHVKYIGQRSFSSEVFVWTLIDRHTWDGLLYLDHWSSRESQLPTFDEQWLRVRLWHASPYFCISLPHDAWYDASSLVCWEC